MDNRRYAVLSYCFAQLSFLSWELNYENGNNGRDVGAPFPFKNIIKCKWNGTDCKSLWGTATRGLVTLHPQFVSQKGSPIYIPW